MRLWVAMLGLMTLGLSIAPAKAVDIDQLGASCGQYTVASCDQHNKFDGSQNKELKACQKMFKGLDAFCASHKRGEPRKKQQLKLDAYTALIAAYSELTMAEFNKRLDKAYGGSEQATPSSGGCEFSACEYGKQRCCQMARKQLRECQAADDENSGNYENYGQEGEAASSAIKECVRCSRVWLQNNRC